jgi:hypothetical protein
VPVNQSRNKILIHISAKLGGIRGHGSFNPSYVVERPDIVKMVPDNISMILDVGCSNGTVRESMKKRFPSVIIYGIEVDRFMAEEASRRLDRVFIADLNSAELVDIVKGHGINSTRHNKAYYSNHNQKSIE